MEALCESTFYVVSNARVRVCARVSLLRRQLYSVPYSTLAMLMGGAWYTHGQHVDLAGRVWWMHVGSSALALDWLSSRANNATLGGKCIDSKPSNMHTSGRVQTGYMQHHPLFGEYTLERNEMKRLRKPAIPPCSLVVVSMCRLVARHASRAAFSCTGRIDNMRHHTSLRKRDSPPMLGPTGVHLLRFRSRAVDPIRESRQNECL